MEEDRRGERESRRRKEEGYVDRGREGRTYAYVCKEMLPVLTTRAQITTKYIFSF